MTYWMSSMRERQELNDSIFINERGSTVGGVGLEESQEFCVGHADFEISLEI